MTCTASTQSRWFFENRFIINYIKKWQNLKDEFYITRMLVDIDKARDAK